MNEFTVITIEDNPCDVEVISEILEDYTENIIHSVYMDKISFILDLNNDKIGKADIFIIDINLPDGNGFDILKEILKHECFLSTPKIIFSSDRSTDTVCRSYDLNANSVVQKSLENAEKMLEYWLLTSRPCRKN